MRLENQKRAETARKIHGHDSVVNAWWVALDHDLRHHSQVQRKPRRIDSSLTVPERALSGGMDGIVKFAALGSRTDVLPEPISEGCRNC